MRARVVLYQPEKKAILLIHRLKAGRDYWVVPGGGAQKAETARATAMREVQEELGLKVTPAELTFLFEIGQGERQVFFFATCHLTTLPAIMGEEKERSNPANLYQPAWVALAELAQIVLMPPQLSTLLINTLPKLIDS